MVRSDSSSVGKILETMQAVGLFDAYGVAGQALRGPNARGALKPQNSPYEVARNGGPGVHLGMVARQRPSERWEIDRGSVLIKPSE